MIKDFINLNEEEQNLLLSTPALITILVAGADSKIDDKEVDWGAKVAHFRSAKEGTVLHDYYYEVDKIYKDTLNDYLGRLPEDQVERTKRVADEMKKLNDIFQKLDPHFAHELYRSFMTYAEQIAKASGGILGYSAISTEEQEMMRLSMIKPVQKPS